VLGFEARLSPPVIALLTDFGLSDHYVGAMKGVMLGICPGASLVDITHEVPPHDVLTGALELAAACGCFPARTVFLVVVDPGVGSARRGLAVEAGDYRFVAPDNGVLSKALEDIPVKRAVELIDKRFMRAVVTRTFEGRDRFGPAAAWLAQGIDLEQLGPPATGLVALTIPRPSVAPGGIDGEVVRVDRFGNLITNIDRSAFESMPGVERSEIHLGSERILRVVSTYADIQPGEVCALFGSTGHLEIAARGSSAAVALAGGRGAAVHIRRPA
jgi:S-adenosyl-L-methionine hydrolase (adenosine-forming)